ncbi:F-box protein CPR1-like [Humulus lupulus]|uniref:F-box protein CPR1-like n=1 Tax=Humulus lupulus TaxID=3486 RepID=UPI002B4094ED|nr:F-box protein CPR1-like [Humulus lupulus]
MTNVPPEIITDILIRLPVKDLLRYRCVSKPWCSLIDSHDFIKRHLSHSKETYSNTGLVLNWSELYWVDLDTLNSAVELNHPIDFGGGTEVLGSCNGLLALFNSYDDVALWNPFTKRYRNLPITEIEFPSDGLCVGQYMIYGFGHDPINDDYKLIRLIQFYGDDDDSFDSEVKVYSLKAKTWKRIKDFPYYLRYNRSYGVHVGNALHWVVSRKPISDVSKLIGAFDIVSEEYHVVPQPDYVDDDFCMTLNVLGGCLCLICNYTSNQSNDFSRESKVDRVDIWVMKEYGVKESWTKLYSVVQSDVISSFNYVFPVTYLKYPGNKILMDQDSKKFILYDLGRNKAESVMIPGMPELFEECVCLQSLVGLGGRDGELSGKKAEKLSRKGWLVKREKKGKHEEATKRKDKRDDFLSRGFRQVLLMKLKS